MPVTSGPIAPNKPAWPRKTSNAFFIYLHFFCVNQIISKMAYDVTEDDDSKFGSQSLLKILLREIEKDRLFYEMENERFTERSYTKLSTTQIFSEQLN